MPGDKHEYFTVSNASYLAHPKDGLCIFAGDAPVRNDNGSTNHSLRAPIVTISSIINNREQIAEVECGSRYKVPFREEEKDDG